MEIPRPVMEFVFEHFELLFFAGSVTIMMITGLLVSKWQRSRARKFEAAMSAEDRLEFAYNAFEKSGYIRNMKWWHWLLFLSLPLVFFGPVWLDMIKAFFAGELDFGDPGIWLILIIIPHIWVYPLFFAAAFIRSFATWRMAKLMVVPDEDTSDPLESLRISTDAPSTVNSNFSIDLVIDLPDVKIRKSDVTSERNAFGTEPRSFLYLYDFRHGQAVTRFNISHSLTEYGPVYRMQSPIEVGLFRYLELAEKRYFRTHCATSVEWVRNFLARTSARPLSKRWPGRRYGRYPQLKFVSVDTIWKNVVKLLFDYVDYVVIDARRFTKDSEGLQWEIEAAAAFLKPSCLIVLADVHTKMADLEEHLRIGWSLRGDEAPGKDGPIKVLRLDCVPEKLKLNKWDEDRSIKSFYYETKDLVALDLLR
jgi:hypothetical protein